MSSVLIWTRDSTLTYVFLNFSFWTAKWIVKGNHKPSPLYIIKNHPPSILVQNTSSPKQFILWIYLFISQSISSPFTFNHTIINLPTHHLPNDLQGQTILKSCYLWISNDFFKPYFFSNLHSLQYTFYYSKYNVYVMHLYYFYFLARKKVPWTSERVVVQWEG